MTIEDFIRQQPTDGTVEIKETVLHKVCTQLNEWENVASNQRQQIEGLQNLVNELRSELEERRSRFLDLEY